MWTSKKKNYNVNDTDNSNDTNDDDKDGRNDIIESAENTDSGNTESEKTDSRDDQALNDWVGLGTPVGL